MIDKDGKRQREFGLATLTLTPEAKHHPFLKGLTEETVTICATHSQHVSELPKDAKVLGFNSADEHQMFAYNDHELSLQDHPEVTRAALHTLASIRSEVMAKEGFTQEKIEQNLLQDSSNRLRDVIFENFIKIIGKQ